jgi:hypothetical protein
MIVNALQWFLPTLFGTLLHVSGLSKAAMAPAFHETLIRLPGISRNRVGSSMLFSFGDARVDSHRSLYLLADQNAGALDVVDVRRNSLVRQIVSGRCSRCRFTGVDSRLWPSRSGPSAIALVDGSSLAWVGDVGAVELVDYELGTIVRTIDVDAPNGMPSLFWSAHACYDSTDRLLMVVNSDDPAPFLSIIDTESAKRIKRIDFPRSLGLGDCAYRAADHSFYFTIAGLPQEQEGALALLRVDRIASNSLKIATFVQPQCSPTALSMDEPQARLLVGCAPLYVPTPIYDLAVHRVPLETVIFDLNKKRFHANIQDVGGAQSIALDSRRSRWYVAAPDMTDTGYPDGNATPVLGIVDARQGRWLENIPTAVSAHSVAVDSNSGRVFVPIRQSSTSDGGIMVLTPTN